jgi:flagellar export protein FliJ
MAAKKFKFRLDPLLSLREHREQERQKEHAAMVAEVQIQKQGLGSIDNKRLSTFDHQRARMVGRLSLAEALVCSRYLVKLKRDRMAGVEMLHALEKTAEQKRQELVKAARDRKIFELLKDKQKLRHRQEFEQLEQKDLDEVAVSSFRQKKKRGLS